ncbi:URH2, partial [Symbiodinium microadriaticum]
ATPPLTASSTTGPTGAWLKRRLQKQAETRARTISEEAESVARPLLLPVCGSAEKLEQVVKKRKQTWQDPSDGAKVDLAEVSRRPPLDPVPSKVPEIRVAPSAAECSRERAPLLRCKPRAA